MIEEFEAFPKIPRWKRNIIITEKIDGTNAQVYISYDMKVTAGSRKRYITPDNDNYGFAKWVAEHEEELKKLGPGRHFGEWWGQSIQRKYGITGRRFSLFNTSRWTDPETRPSCVDVVPILYHGPLNGEAIENALTTLREGGSLAAPGFMNPEGIVVFHMASNSMFKVTLDHDEIPKGLVNSAKES